MKRPSCLVLVLILAGCGAPPPPQAQGVIEAYEETLAFPLAGRVQTLAVEEGQRISAGVPLATVDGDVERLAVRQAEAALALAEAELAQVRAAARPELLAAARARASSAHLVANLEAAERLRQEGLAASHVTSQRDLDRAVQTAAQSQAEAIAADNAVSELAAGGDQPAVAVAQARLAVAQSALASAQERLAKTTLLSPPGERVVRHFLRHPGELVLAGTPVVTVADLARPYIDAFLPEGQAARLHPGDPAQVRIDGVAPLTGAVERVGERLEFTPRFLFGPEDRPHLMIRVRVRLAGPAPAAGVPADVQFGPLP